MDGHCEDSEEEDLVVVEGLDEATGFAGEVHLASGGPCGRRSGCGKRFWCGNKLCWLGTAGWGMSLGFVIRLGSGRT